ncbi:hypothetical protein [Vibrio vulnificus YJ016]|uniref:Uncharacterized protein n=1 Tax=Vibrio vulnificus (strain YJ016) TaxID=196600 RepID=Q7MM65_VIBVY|nr:hypothetical protein [Vibrio vulnificus YJ016]
MQVIFEKFERITDKAGLNSNNGDKKSAAHKETALKPVTG